MSRYLGVIGRTSSRLLRNAGRLWSNLMSDTDLYRAIFEAYTVNFAQQYADIAEAADALNRYKSPVFHRKRWAPLKISADGRGYTRIGRKAVIGGQTDPAYVVNSTIRIGCLPEYKNLYAYTITGPVPEDTGIITDSVFSPSYILHKNKDYSVDGTMLFSTIELTDNSTIWAYDASFDRDYVDRFMGRALGIKLASSEQSKDIANALWDLLTEGDSRKNVTNVIQAMCGNEATVEVYTGKELLALRDEGRALPPVTLPPRYFLSSVEGHMTFPWGEVPVVYRGAVNGVGLLDFNVVGSDSDVKKFWDDVHTKATQSGADMYTLVGVSSPPASVKVGDILGYISPAEFVLKNFVGNSIIIVDVDYGAANVDITSMSSALFKNLLSTSVDLSIVGKVKDPDSVYGSNDLSEHDVSQYVLAARGDNVIPGHQSNYNASYYDAEIVVSWVPNCRGK